MWRKSPSSRQPWSRIRFRWTSLISSSGTIISSTVVATAQVAPASSDTPRCRGSIRRCTAVVRNQNSIAERCAAV